MSRETLALPVTVRVVADRNFSPGEEPGTVDQEPLSIGYPHG
jgi:hypothetical protein